MKKKRGYQFLTAFLLVGVLLAVVLGKTGIYFETNDDRIITEILSGAMTGQPENTPYYVNYLLSVPLAALYGMTGKIPWYGMFLVALHAASLLLMFLAIYRKSKDLWSYLCCTGICVAVMLADLYLLGMLQYTSTAALAAIAGYVCLILEKDTKGGWLGFTFLELGAYLLRSQSMLMIQPIGLLLLITLVIAHRGLKNGAVWAGAGKVVGVLALILSLGTLAVQIGYSSPEWKEYREYNRARTELFDYYGTPEYEEVQDILEKYGVTKPQYDAYRKYVLLYPDVSTRCQEELVEFQKAKQDTHFSIQRVGGLLSTTLQVCVKGYYFRMNLFAICLWGLVLLWVVGTRRWRLLLPVGGLGCSFAAVCVYLVYGGRYPYRVMMPLFLCLAVFSMTVVMRELPAVQASVTGKSMIQKGGLAVVCLCIAVGGYLTGSQQYRQILTANRQQALLIQGRKQVKEYCLQHPQERYLLDTASFSDYKGSALETDIYGTQNSMYTGSWHSGSPTMYTYQQQYLEGYEKNISLIIADTGEALSEQMEHAVTKYFTHVTGVEPVLEDRFTVPHGGSYLVWHYRAGEEKDELDQAE